jgi:integrase
MMRYAYREGWVLRDIFYNAKVIETSSEKARNVTLSSADGKSCFRVLKANGKSRIPTGNGKTEVVRAKISAANPLLKAMIILALDSGLRRGEILKLRWSDIDFQNECIHIVGTHTKTEQQRLVPLSERAREELIRL